MIGLRTGLLGILLAAVALAAGCAAAFAFVAAWTWFVPFRPEWDDTWHELLPVGLAYGLWLGVSLGIFLIGFRRIRRRASERPS